MKRLLLAALISLAACPLAFAQESRPFAGGGFSIEFVGGSSAVAFTFQGGAHDLLGSLGLRGNFDIGISGSFFELAVDLLADFTGDDFTPYVGGGFGIVPGDDIDFNIHGVGGIEFGVADAVGLFGEIQPKFYVTSGTAFGVALRFGANYHFD